MPNQINTAEVERRTLRFESIDEVTAEVDRLVASERAGTLVTIGNWTLGQIFGHLAVWVEYSFNGAPMKAPWLVKVLMRLLVGKDRFINEPMRAGVRIPKVPGGTLGTEVLPTAVAAESYITALRRLRQEAPTKPNILFGPLTHEEWIKLNLRHAELHLGFVRP